MPLNLPTLLKLMTPLCVLTALLALPAWGQAEADDTAPSGEGTVQETGQDDPAEGEPSQPTEPRTVVGDNPSFASPEEVFEAAKSAFNARDWKAFLQVVNPDRRDELIGSTAITFAFMAEQPEADPRIGELVEQYLPDDVNAAELQMGSDDPRAERIRLAKRMGRPAEFFAAAMNLGFVLEHGEEAEEVKVTELAELETNEEGTSARGKATVQTPDGNRQMPWGFEKFKGNWYLSMQ